MELNALKIDQNGKEFYLCSIDAKTLTDEDIVHVDIWRKSGKDGYQRKATESRCKQFATYIERANGISPTSILLSVRNKVKFKAQSGNFGVLNIPEEESLWVIDGQHRIKGLYYLADKNPEYDNFNLPSIIIPLDDEYEEAKQFVIINKTQKGVRSDLAERFLADFAENEGIHSYNGLPKSITRGISWIPKALKIVDEMNENSEIWKNKVIFPNEPKNGAIISQKSFTDSLQPILESGLFDTYNSIEISEMLNRYWQAIKKLCPEAFDLPKSCVLQKTAGVFVLHKLFPVIARHCADETGSSVFSVDRIYGVLKKIDSMQSEFSEAGGTAGQTGTSQKSFGILYNMLNDELLENIDSEDAQPIRPFKL